MLRIFCTHSKIRRQMEERQREAHVGDCGVDLFISSMRMADSPSPPQITIGTGVKVAAFDEQGRPTGCLLYPRSSLSKTPFMLANSVGVIDAGYRGEVMAKLNRIAGSHNRVNLSQDGLRLVQICLPTLQSPQVVFVDSEDDLGTPPDTRGSGGFGSSSGAAVDNPSVTPATSPVTEAAPQETPVPDAAPEPAPQETPVGTPVSGGC